MLLNLVGLPFTSRFELLGLSFSFPFSSYISKLGSPPFYNHISSCIIEIDQRPCCTLVCYF